MEKSKEILRIQSLLNINLRLLKVDEDFSEDEVNSCQLSVYGTLVCLNLKGNKIQDLSFLKGLRHLQELYLDNNRITNLEPLKRLYSLTVLSLDSNEITSVTALKNLRNLYYLSLEKNNISDVYELREIVKSLKDLKSLALSNNPVKIDKNYLHDFQLLKSYLIDSEKGITEKRNLKLLFLGDGCVGKSTLLQHLQKLDIPDDIAIDNRTEGVQLDIWQEVLPNVKVNVWDFGGQEILHSTHRLFLGEKAIYILVWCKENNKICSQHETHNLKYWLDFIADYGKQSIVLLVENIINNEFDNIEFLNHMLTELVTNYRRRDIDLITTLHRFDCKNNTDEVISFKDVIKNKIISLQNKYPVYNYPQNWFLLQERIENINRDIKTITINEYLKIASDYDIYNPMTLLQLFHESGVLSYIPNFSTDTVILQIDWILDGIYKCLQLKDNPLSRTNGKLTDSDLDFIWQGYTEKEKQLFKEYMIGSNLLSLPIKRDYKYLCPALFKKKIDKVIWDNGKEYIVIQFNFTFSAIMDQLLVRVLNHCQYEEENEEFYKNYIYFFDMDFNEARIEMFEEKKELRIYCENKKMTEIILNEINEIFPLERLKIFLRKGKKEKEFDYKKSVFGKMFDALNIPVKKIFISYSHRDIGAMYELSKFLKVLERNGQIEKWTDLKLESGVEVKSEILDKLDAADIVILLISQDFIASDFIFDNELPKAIRKKLNGTGNIVPVYLSESTIFDLELDVRDETQNNITKVKMGDYYFVPQDYNNNLKPIEEWPFPAKAWKKVYDEIKKYL
ncbi:MAG: COR domain-containing protein [Flavobacterium sp.]